MNQLKIMNTRDIKIKDLQILLMHIHFNINLSTHLNILSAGVFRLKHKRLQFTLLT